jgi:hypothetical protein
MKEKEKKKEKLLKKEAKQRGGSPSLYKGGPRPSRRQREASKKEG